MSYGILAADPEIRGSWEPGVEADLDPELPTRWEEYRLVWENVPAGSEVLDVGTGYVENWHVLPEILVQKGCEVRATDADPRTLALPSTSNDSIYRHVIDLFHMDGGGWSSPIVTCISVLEHILGRQADAFRRLADLTEERLILTADGLDPEVLAQWAEHYGLDPGERTPDPDSPLDPSVTYLIADRR